MAPTIPVFEPLVPGAGSRFKVVKALLKPATAMNIPTKSVGPNRTSLVVPGQNVDHIVQIGIFSIQAQQLQPVDPLVNG